MSSFRSLILDRRKLTWLLLLLALGVKALVPGGYMIERKAMLLSVTICADSLGAHQTQQLVIPMKGDAQIPAGGHQKEGGHCAFSSLGFGSLAAADPILLAGALLFILTLGFLGQLLPGHQSLFRLRPPLRGPPSFI